MIDDFLDKFGGSKDPSYSFYGGEVELFYNDARHFYYILKDGEQVIQDGVTNAVHIIDKSEMLIPWAAKMTIEKLLRTVPTRDARINLSFDEFEKVAMEAKSAHRERLEDADREEDDRECVGRGVVLAYEQVGDERLRDKAAAEAVEREQCRQPQHDSS